jgi:hypothetical protein
MLSALVVVVLQHCHERYVDGPHVAELLLLQEVVR